MFYLLFIYYLSKQDCLFMVVRSAQQAPRAVAPSAKDAAAMHMFSRAATLRNFDLENTKISYFSIFTFLFCMSAVITAEIGLFFYMKGVRCSPLGLMLNIPVFMILSFITVFILSKLCSYFLSVAHNSTFLSLFVSTLVYQPFIVLCSFLPSALFFSLSTMINASVMSYYLMESLRSQYDATDQRTSLLMSLYCFITQYLLSVMVPGGAFRVFVVNQGLQKAE
ncbi:hypothetical protein ENBRE01_1857 [Enteropsectra breve]|nr:hypothetical protein ENBRE01_1857 [Enteropsectra breve]